MAEDNAGAVGEGEGGAGSDPFVGEAGEEALAEVLEVFEVGLADFAEEEAFEAGETLAIIEGHLGEEPKGFAAAAGAPEADGGGALGTVAKTGRSAGGKLLGLEDDPSFAEMADLVGRATVERPELEVGGQWANQGSRGWRVDRW